ncbi:DUF1203 domain-containing protein [Streptomyces sp. NPDC059009]|uniref:DUF1203 domain-containing protein n=1 Tax=Streptomyces sp. NPDC059009 TaxID=3346694 RepID=UPI0036C3C00D
MTTTTAYTPLPIPRETLTQLREVDDAGRPCAPFTDPEGGDPLRCCLRPVRPGERIALVSYAPLRRWAAETGAEPGAYEETGPVFIHAEDAGCEGPGPTDGTYPFDRPGALRTVRRYNAQGHIIGGQLVEISAEPTGQFDKVFAEAFADPEVALVHVRAVEYGCFHYEVRRQG